MSRARRFVVMLSIALSVSLHTATAFAAPVGWKSIDVTLQSEQQQSLLLVSGELPAQVKLPAEAELAVPAGTQLQWIGEILGDDPSKDPPLTYEKSSANGVDIYRFTLTRGRIAQVEGIVPLATSFDGSNYVTALRWTAWQAVPEVRISQRIPQSSQIVQAAAGATVQPGDTGYSYYTKTVTGAKAGEVLDLSFSYALPAAGASSAGNPGSGNGTPAIAIILVIALGGFGLMAARVNRKIAAKAALETPQTKRSPKSSAQSQPVESARPGKSRVNDETVVEPAPPTKARPLIPVLIVLGLVFGGFAFAGSKGTSAAVRDGKISRNFGAPSACQSALVPFTANQGVDLATQGDQLLEGLEGMEGVGVVTVDLAQSTIDMGWCESSQSEDSMRQALTATGLITLGQAAAPAESSPVSATVDASGKKQTVSVDTSSGSFAPGQITLKSGLPAELSFGQASGCLTEVVIADLGIDQDLASQGPTTVSLPALEPGTYTFACAMGHQSGQLVVQ